MTDGSMLISKSKFINKNNLNKLITQHQDKEAVTLGVCVHCVSISVYVCVYPCVDEHKYINVKCLPRLLFISFFSSFTLYLEH